MTHNTDKLSAKPLLTEEEMAELRSLCRPESELLLVLNHIDWLQAEVDRLKAEAHWGEENMLNARYGALEEAAKVSVSLGDDEPTIGQGLMVHQACADFIAAAIRALKEQP